MGQNSVQRQDMPEIHMSQAQATLAEARRALQSGRKSDARRLAMQAAALAPGLEDPWLVLAAVAGPRASQAYLQRALQINPNSTRARRGLEWAAQRAVETPPDVVYRPTVRPEQPDTVVYQVAGQPAKRRKRAVRLALAALFLLACLALSAWVFVQPSALIRAGLSPEISVRMEAARVEAVRQVGGLAGLAPRVGLRDFPATAAAMLPSPTAGDAPLPSPTERGAGGEGELVGTPGVETGAGTPPLPSPANGGGESSPTPFVPLTDTPTPTITPTPTVTPIPTETPLPTDTATLASPPTDVPPPPTQTALPQPEPTRKPKKPKPPQVDGPALRPAEVDAGERWIDVDLSTQMTYAMEGDQAVNQFLVSTGRWPTVTVTGVYKIYVKYQAADMSGADYYLEGVPYVMYFYKGYGIHGTYWHNNFGTPMSHGCVNLRPADAGWLFEFARVGTVVNVHP